MTEKQEKVLRLGMRLHKTDEFVNTAKEGEPEKLVDQSKDFNEILLESLDNTSKTNLFNNLKTELIKRENAKKLRIDNVIANDLS